MPFRLCWPYRPERSRRGRARRRPPAPSIRFCREAGESRLKARKSPRSSRIQASTSAIRRVDRGRRGREQPGHDPLLGRVVLPEPDDPAAVQDGVVREVGLQRQRAEYLLPSLSLRSFLRQQLRRVAAQQHQ